MPTRTEVETYRQANQNVATLAYAEVAALWATLDLTNAAAASQVLQETLPDLIRAYGDMAAVLAADFYDSLREQSSARNPFAATLAAIVPDEQIQASTRWAISPLFPRTEQLEETGFSRVIDPDPDAALARLEGPVQRLTLQAGRDTIAQSIDLDPSDARWARIPTGAETCAFCLVLASRGSDYGSFESAGAKELPDGSNPHAYHDACDCVATPFWGGDDYPEGYDPDALLQMYTDARDKADTGRLKGRDSILSALREQQGIH